MLFGVFFGVLLGVRVVFAVLFGVLSGVFVLFEGLLWNRVFWSRAPNDEQNGSVRELCSSCTLMTDCLSYLYQNAAFLSISTNARPICFLRPWGVDDEVFPKAGM